MMFRPFSLRLASLALALSLAACGQNLDDARFPTGSQTLTSSSDYSRVYVANVDAGTVSILSADGTLVSKVDVGILPTRIARAGDKVLVTLKGERAVAVLQETAEGLEPVTVIEVGAEPYGVVANERGELAYVAVSQGNEVVEIDVATGEVTRRFAVSDQPAFLALHPSEKALYVGSLMNGTFSYIDLRGSVRWPSWNCQ
jgi:DNA-binding beta-propeller fold protein YncE